MANEKRFIDANAADVNEIPCYHDEYCTTEDVQHWLNEQPTVDVVEVVRCKDCKHCTVTSDGMVCENALPTKRMQDYYIYGSTILARVEPDAFCSYGEKRDGDGNG